MKIIVIGGGPAGYTAAITAAKLGGEVTLVERDKLGGLHLNHGCIPARSLLHIAHVYEQALAGEEYGILANMDLDFEKMQTKKNHIIKRLSDHLDGAISSNNIDYYNACVSFVDDNKICMRFHDGRLLELTADKFIIASGSKPIIPPIFPMDKEDFLTADEALRMPKLPKSMVFVGGGVVGVELATLFSTLGVDVTIVEKQNNILNDMDQELVKLVYKSLSKKVKIYTGADIESIEKRPMPKLTAAMGDTYVDIIGEKVIICCGREANISGLNLHSAYINTFNGHIVVDGHQRTNHPSFYAAGDCVGGTMLAHVATRQGEVAASNAMGKRAVYDGKNNPLSLYTHPEFASVGLTEKQAAELGIDHVVGRFSLSTTLRSMLLDMEGMIKIVAGKRFGEILGVQIIAPNATDVVHEAALAIRLESTTEDLLFALRSRPTVGDSVREAAMAIYVESKDWQAERFRGDVK